MLRLAPGDASTGISTKAVEPVVTRPVRFGGRRQLIDPAVHFGEPVRARFLLNVPNHACNRHRSTVKTEPEPLNTAHGRGAGWRSDIFSFSARAGCGQTLALQDEDRIVLRVLPPLDPARIMRVRRNVGRMLISLGLFVMKMHHGKAGPPGREVQVLAELAVELSLTIDGGTLRIVPPCRQVPLDELERLEGGNVRSNA